MYSFLNYIASLKINLIYLLTLFICIYTTDIYSNNSTIDTVFVDKVSNNRTLNQVVSEYDNGTTVLILESAQYVTPQIKIKVGVEISSENGSIIIPDSSSSMTSLIKASAPLTLDNIVLDGNNIIAWGIYTTSSLEINNSFVQCFYGDSKTPANGIRHVPDSKNEDLIILNTIFRYISSYEDGIVGNYVGATRGVLSSGGNIIIKNNTFIDIQGKEDSDCIHIQTDKSDSIEWKSAGRVKIIQNDFQNFGKRAIKIQASDVFVSDNTVFSDESQIYAGISIYGSNNSIINNTISLANATAGITITSGVDNLIKDNTIDLLRVLPENKVWGIVLNNKDNANIVNNSLKTRGQYYPIYLTKFKLDYSKKTYQKQNKVFVKKRIID